MAPKRAWFAQKTYGYGASLPIAWQGWVALAIFVVLAAAAAAWLPGLWRWGGLLGLTVLFTLVCRDRTEGGWRWRWGGD